MHFCVIWMCIFFFPQNFKLYHPSLDLKMSLERQERFERPVLIYLFFSLKERNYGELAPAQTQPAAVC